MQLPKQAKSVIRKFSTSKFESQGVTPSARCGCPEDTSCAGVCQRLCNFRGCFDVCGGVCVPHLG